MANHGELTPSESEQHYIQLREFFITLLKWVLLAWTIIVGAAGYFLLTSVADMKKDVADFKKDALASIEITKTLTEQQIKTIQSEARQLAREEAYKRVEEVFRNTNISSLIEATAKRQVGASVQKLVADEMLKATARLHEETSQLGSISDYASKMRLGFRDGLIGLDKLRRDVTGPDVVRNTATILYSRIAVDYDSVTYSYYGADTGKDPIKRRAHWHLPENTTDSALTVHLVRVIMNSTELTDVAMATLVLRVHTGIAFKMFELDQIRDYCKKHGISY